MGRKNNYLIDIVLCICVVSIALLFWYQGLFAQYAVYFLLWLHIFVVTLLLRSVPLKTSPSHRVDIALFMKENKRDKYYAVKYFFLINRHYIFPIILVVYLIFLLVGQTKLWGLEKTMGTIQQANMEGNLIRSHMAKIMVNWAISEMGLVPDASASCTFNDIAVVSPELQAYIILACKLGIMGVNTDGIFNPNGTVTRGMSATVLSRILYGDTYNGGVPYYVNHIAALQSAGILTVTNPNLIELRAYIMLMLYRIHNM